jgi:hypothetical protein
MLNEIKHHFDEAFSFKITKDVSMHINQVVRQFEIRGTHPLALNGPLLGVYDLKFLPDDRAALFNIFNVSESEVRNLIMKIPSIKKEFKVVSDPFNVFCAYLLHVIQTSTSISSELRHSTAVDVGLYFQYKLFSSIVNNSFQYRANEEIMTKVIEDLTNKFDIRTFGTWRNLLLNRVETLLLSHSGLYYQVIMKFDNDNQIVYLISGVSTRIHSQIVKIAKVYYEYHKQGDKISSAKIDTEVDGDRIVRERQASMDIMKSIITSEIHFGNVHDRYIVIITALFGVVNENLLRKSLSTIHYKYLAQTKTKGTTKSAEIKDGITATGADTYYEGLDLLVEKLFEGAIELLVKSELKHYNNLTNLLNVLKKALTASRLSNQYLLNVKYSLRKLIMDSGVVRREATISSLIPAIELYYLLCGFAGISKNG